MTSRQKSSLNFVETFVLSGAAAMVSRTMKTPADKWAYFVTYQTRDIGGIAGALSLGCMYSLVNARQRRLADFKLGKSKLTFNSLIDVYRKTLLTEGIGGLYRGFVIACLHAIIYRGCYFGFYDTLKTILLGQNPNFFLSFILAYGVTAVSDLIAWPFDTIRR
ncbi:unnamed protein product, partial [Adineta steineri]